MPIMENPQIGAFVVVSLIAGDELYRECFKKFSKYSCLAFLRLFVRDNEQAFSTDENGG